MKEKNTNIKKILIVDDEEEICILLAYALRKLRYKVDYALTLKDGSRKLKNMQPEIVLLDLQLPDGSGFSMIPEIREAQSTFVVISAYDDGKEKALQQGAAHFIKKPFSLETISQTISNLRTKRTT